MNDAVVLSAAEFDVVWEAERLGRRHVALDVPSPGATHAQRSEVVERAWRSLQSRGLAARGRASGDLLDLMGVLAAATESVDVWAWAETEVRGLAAATGRHAALGVVEGGQVWLIPVRPSALADAAVSVAGERPAGVGQSVTVPYRTLRAAAERASDPHDLVTVLQDQGVELFHAQELAGMLLGVQAKGQFGAERQGPDGQRSRAGRVVAFHDTDSGRYLMQVERNPDDEQWCTLAPADNTLLATRVWELLDDL